MIGLLIILLSVLILPLSVKWIEEHIEIFFFVMGLLAVTVSGLWNLKIIEEALLEPIKITMAVLTAGVVFKFPRKHIETAANLVLKALGIRSFIFFLVVLLGLMSSVITAIIAALLLVEIVSHLKLDRKNEIVLVVMACFSIGMGAALTPIGEPLSTITISKLKGEPFNADFWFLLSHLGTYIIPGIIAVGIAAVLMTRSIHHSEKGLHETRKEEKSDILIMTGKVYLFVAALILLGAGFKPLVDGYVSKMSYYAIYWINSFSAVLDNATMAAAEIGPSMQLVQIKAAVLGLITAGGMMIPGNIPNIIASGKLRIKSKEWAAIGIPVGLVAMAVYFVVLEIIN